MKVPPENKASENTFELISFFVMDVENCVKNASFE